MTHRFQPPDFLELQQHFSTVHEEQVRAVLRKSNCTLNDLAILLSPAAEQFLPLMAARSREITEQRFGCISQIFDPLYRSNFCINRCAY